MKQHEEQARKLENEPLNSYASSLALSRTSLDKDYESEFSSVSSYKPTPLNMEAIIKIMEMDYKKMGTWGNDLYCS